MPLTQVAIKNAKADDKAVKLFDSGGLFLLVQPAGGKWWRYKYRFAGKEKLLALGSYPDVSLAQARERHAQARKTLAEGKDPGEIKKVEKRLTLVRHENSFEAVAREWHAKRSQAWTPKYAANSIHRMESNIFPKIGGRPIAEITPPELLAALRVIESRGAHDLAHRLQQLCGQVFSYAVAAGYAERNPVNDLRGALTPAVTKHNAYLKAAELPEFLQKMAAYDGVQTRMAMKFLLLTFVRTGEVRGALWSEIDLPKAEWRIPAERMKMRDPHIVPLSRQAVALLEELKPLTGYGDHVFPSQHKPSGSMSENTILYALYRMGYHGKSTGHGFRATASTILNEHGFRPDVIERQLAHAERNGVRKAYNHAQYLPERREMMQWWADYLDQALVNT
jgi:integrase